MNQRSKSRNALIKGVVDSFRPLIYNESRTRELNVTKAAAYIIKEYQLHVPPKAPEDFAKSQTKLMAYPRVNDARIILTAYDNDCGIVTQNVKDFLIYSVMGYTVWDPSYNYQVFLDPLVIQNIHRDPVIINQHNGLNY